MRRTKYTEEQFSDAVLSSFSIAGVLTKIGLKATGANYLGVKLRAEKLGLNLSHFTGQGHLKGKGNPYAKKRPLSEYLIEHSDCTNHNALKRRLMREGLLENKCSQCGISTWNGKPLVLQFEHRNGNKRDNRIDNLTLLCPNCHSQTETFAGKNKRRRGGTADPVGSNPTEAIRAGSNPVADIKTVAK